MSFPALIWRGDLLYLGDLYVGEIAGGFTEKYHQVRGDGQNGRPWRIWWNAPDREHSKGECSEFHPSESEARAALEAKIKELV